MSRRLASVTPLLLFVTAPARAEPVNPRWESPPAPPAQPCVERLSSDAAVDEALRGATVEVEGETRPRPFSSVRITGLATLPEAEVWTAVGGRPERLDPHLVAVVVRRLVSLRIFARVAPVVRVARGPGIAVDIAVTEQPQLRRVVFEGLTEVRPERLLPSVLPVPEGPAGPDASGEVHVGAERGHRSGNHDDHQPACFDPVVPVAWLARAEGAAVHAGILRDGPQPALARLLHTLFDLGYEMASLTAALGDDGVLTIRIDEGRLEGVEITGVARQLEPQVRARLDLPVGRPLQVSALDPAMERVRAVFPFLHRGRARRPVRPEPQVQEEPRSAGGRRFATVPAPPISAASMDDDDDSGDDDDHDDRRARRWYAIEGHRLVVSFEVRRFDFRGDPSELIRHTPVTGFAPGLVGTAGLWDPRNEVHAGVDLGGNVNTNRARRPLADPAAVAERWRIDWLVGARVQVPRFRVAELGVQRYSRVDTTDRWRIDRVDSYVYSALFNRPVTDYFHRDGLTAFLTAHWLDRVLAGLEYRRDRYASLESIDRYFTLFYRREPARVTPPVTEGEMRSILVRLEYSSLPTPAHRVRGLWRDPERALSDLAGGERWQAELRTVNTLEIADPGLLGGDDVFHFVRMVSDTVVQEPIGHHHQIKARFRAAGRLGSGQLPLQKQEALGGWSALRGYDFKELAGGNFSLLGTVEYRFRSVSVFFDGGQVRTEAGFGAVKVAGGLVLGLGSGAHLDVAWRLDDRARLMPAVRFFFNRTF
jgi:hypothetical protein